MTILTKSVAIPEKALIEAICLRTSDGYFALAMANAFGGRQSDAWDLANNHSLIELLDEANRLGISLKDAKSVIEGRPVMHTPAYLLAKGLITDHDYQRHRNWLKSMSPEREEKLAEIEARFAVLGELVE